MPSPSGSHRILCIDDDGIAAAARRLHLASCGYSVTAAPDPLEGLRIFRDDAFDAVLFDYAMPLVRSWDIAAIMRYIRSASVLLLLSDDGDCSAGGLPVFDRHLPRRPSPSLLLHTLSDLLRHRRPANGRSSSASSAEGPSPRPPRPEARTVLLWSLPEVSQP